MGKEGQCLYCSKLLKTEKKSEKYEKWEKNYEVGFESSQN